MSRWLLSLTAALALAAPPKMLRQSPIERPEPDGFTEVSINPPAFRWPMGKGGPYTLQISASRDFAGSGSSKLHLRPNRVVI